MEDQEQKLIKYFKNLKNINFTDFLNDLSKSIKNEEKRFIVTANPETFMTATNNDDLDKILSSEDVTLVADGIGIVKGAKILSLNIEERIPGVELAEELLKFSHLNRKKVFLYGASPEVQDRLHDVIVGKYPNLVLVGSEDGYTKDSDEVFNEILEEEPDLILVALGVPRQEIEIWNRYNAFSKGVFIGVGGSFDVISGAKKRAPKFIRKCHMEWLYRIVKEPKRIKRFMNSNVKYLKSVRKIKKCKSLKF